MSSGTQIQKTQKGLAGCCLGLLLLFSPAAFGQTVRGPRDYLSTDRYGHAYRDSVFGDDPYHEERSLRSQAAREDRSSRYDRQRVRIEEDRLADRSSYSDIYPFSPRGQYVAPPREEMRPPAYADPYTLPKKRYRDGVIRNNYAGAPVYRHFYGGVDRYDSPGYLDDAGRASALSNGYVRRGVAEFSGQGYAGVRPNDVYPLNRDVNPRRYRGRFLNGEVVYDDQDTSGANELEDFIRSELSVRPGANLRVSSTGTWTFRNYLDAGNQVHARFRIPAHRAFGYGRTP